jgi:hypothetical protein
MDFTNYEIAIRGTSRITFCSKYYSSDQIKKNEIERSGSTYGESRGAYRGSQWERGHFVEEGIDGNLISKWILKK